MTKRNQKINNFIKLRIEGYSFDKIATELKVSKQSLIAWNKDFNIRTAIDEAQKLKMDTLVKEYGFFISERLKGYLELSSKLNKELEKRELNNLSTETLIKLSIQNDTRICSLLPKSITIGEKELIPASLLENENGYFELEFKN